MNKLEKKTYEVYRTFFTHTPQYLIHAPGRVNIIGEHTDYNGGFVFPVAINFGTTIAASARDDQVINVVAIDMNEDIDQFSLTEPIQQCDSDWKNYVRGSIKLLQEEGFELRGANLVISGNVPKGAGLSSSASLEVAVLQTFKTLFKLETLDQITLAKIAQRAENQFVGCACGIMDQLISSCGEKGTALLIDCHSLHIESVKIPEEFEVIIFDSNVKRKLIGSEYNDRRNDCEKAAQFFCVNLLRELDTPTFNQRSDELPERIRKRARHVITENERTLSFKEALLQSDYEAIHSLMAASHNSMRLDFEITTPEIDTLVQLINDELNGAGGVRMTGGGFGGCVVALVPRNKIDKIQTSIQKQYKNITGLTADCYVCDASRGAFAQKL